jgi:hypothetical protein
LKEISYRNSGVKSARIILPLDEVQWRRAAAVRKNVFCYGINQNQAENLPAAATRLDPRRQYHPA